MSDTIFIEASELKVGDILSDGNVIKSIDVPENPLRVHELLITYESGKYFHCNKYEKFSVKK